MRLKKIQKNLKFKKVRNIYNIKTEINPKISRKKYKMDATLLCYKWIGRIGLGLEISAWGYTKST